MPLAIAGNLLLCAVLVASCYAIALGLLAGARRPEWLPAARFATYAACALVACAVLVLAYAFQTHAFPIRYVARYSDRSMSRAYLVTALWGGQDGSLLWWSFLLCGYTAACTRWMRGRFLQLQPYVLATLMSILAFFTVLMLFAANPFATFVAGAPADGEGLNPLLQNYWMTIHPPSLYMGFVGWSVPFAFAISALGTGRLHEEWIEAARRWALVAWGFLSLGLMLGMLWSYEELGWGGYWAWDPVENASFHPWLVGTAYLHSVVVQERYRMLKLWNLVLICLAFFLTIFGTFLTRSGLIASVHSFARSDIGIFFVWYMAALIVGCVALMIWRLPKLTGVNRIEALLSREFAFLLNNWILLGMALFVIIATTFPLISEALRGEEVTVGPGFYNRWMVPFGLVLMLLMGIGPLISWRKATGSHLLKAMRHPLLLSVAVGSLHLAFGAAVGFPAWRPGEAMYDTWTGQVLAAIYAATPVTSSSICTFVLAAIGQEFWRGTAVRRRNTGEPVVVALVRLVSRARRRYGGYIVHVGIILMVIGFTGAAYDLEKEAALRPGETLTVGRYHLRYEGPRMVVDRNKRMIFGDLRVLDGDGVELARVSPAKFIYRTHPQMPTTEVAIRATPLEDLYVILSTVDPQTKRATIRVVVRPLVMWIWIGGLVLLFGTLLAMLPSARELLEAEEERRRHRQAKGRRLAAAVASSAGLWRGTWLCLALVGSAASSVGLWSTLWSTPAQAQSDSSSSLHAGTVVMHDATERQLFEKLLCMCGDCARLPLNTCGCGWADNARAELRAQLAQGDSVSSIVTDWRAKYGPRAISMPDDHGLDRALWAVPVGAVGLGVLAVFWVGRRWRRRGAAAARARLGTADATTETSSLRRPSGESYAAALEDELKRSE